MKLVIVVTGGGREGTAAGMLASGQLLLGLKVLWQSEQFHLAAVTAEEIMGLASQSVLAHSQMYQP